VTPWPLLILLAGSAAADADDGEYLFNAAGCLACHTAKDGEPLAGGRPFETPYGTFYSPNISPDRQTGIGAWSRREFIDALKHGTAPDGSAYYPVFPYPFYRLMTDSDAGKIFDYLQTRTAQSQANRAHDTPWWLFRWMMKLCSGGSWTSRSRRQPIQNSSAGATWSTPSATAANVIPRATG